MLHLYYYEDMTTEEIARLLDRSPATVRSQLMRGAETAAGAAGGGIAWIEENTSR